jgi:RNA polymerase sigma factor (sigma-70 family)
MNNGDILEQLRSGQPGKTLGELYKAYPSIRHFIKTHGGTDDDARDVFQECLIVLFRNAQKNDFVLTASVNTYLFSVGKYLWKDLLKKKNREVRFTITDIPAEEIKSVQEEEMQLRWLDRILASLGEKCSEILQLFYYKKMSMEEIAAKLGYRNVDTAKTQKYKCLERARAMASEMNVTTEKMDHP